MSLRLHLFVSDGDPGNEVLCARGWMQIFSCTVAGMERFSLDFLQAVKKRCALKMGCRDERNLWSQANIFLTL